MIGRRPLWLTMVWYGASLCLALLAIGPAVWLLLQSLQPGGEDLRTLTWKFTLANYRSAWTDGKLLGPLLNSAFITIARAALNVALAALAAYPLARMKFKGRDAIFVLLLATMMIPEQVIVVPMFTTIVKMGLFDSLMAVILPFSVSAFGIYLCRQAFLQVPVELEEAARIDGAGSLRVWWNVMLPLSAPTLATLALFSIIGAWSELLWPLIVLQERGNFTLPVAVNNLMGQFSTNVRTAYAGAMLALLPIIAVFILIQGFLKGELFAGSVKG